MLAQADVRCTGLLWSRGLPQPSQQHKESSEPFLPSQCWPAAVCVFATARSLKGFLPQHLLVVALGERKPGEMGRFRLIP